MPVSRAGARVGHRAPRLPFLRFSTCFDTFRKDSENGVQKMFREIVHRGARRQNGVQGRQRPGGARIDHAPRPVRARLGLKAVAGHRHATVTRCRLRERATSSALFPKDIRQPAQGHPALPSVPAGSPRLADSELKTPRSGSGTLPVRMIPPWS